MPRRFLVKLKDAHDESQKTIYRVSKDTGLMYNTVKKYVSAYMEAEKLTPEVVQLAEYYGADWRDPAVVEIIEVDEEDTKPVNVINDGEDEGQMKAPLAVPA